jgi:hypothetical protein
MAKIFSNSNTFKHIGVAVFILVISLLLSCEKDVDIKLPPGQEKIVIEGGIESSLPPFVLISKSIGYFATIDLNTLQNSFIHDAEVYVSDDNKTVRLKEYSVDTGTNGNLFYYYSLIDLANPVLPPADSLILGQLEKTYKLTVKYNGQTYEAYTKIPTPTPLDSVKTKQPNRPEADPNSRVLDIYFRDPDTAGNFLRYYTSLNNGPYTAGLNSVFNDEIINGKEFNTELSLGEPRSVEKPFDSLGVCYPGDTVVLKWTAIDRQVYDFWSTYEYALGTLGSPFATPIQVKTNISNGALGVWAGYGSIYKTIVAE